MNYTPSKQTLKEVRVRLLKRDLSFSGYCRDRGLIRQNLAAAITGKLTGPKAEAMFQSVMTDLGMKA